MLPAGYLVSGRKVNVGNEVTEYAKKDMEKKRSFFTICFTSSDIEKGKGNE